MAPFAMSAALDAGLLPGPDQGVGYVLQSPAWQVASLPEEPSYPHHIDPPRQSGVSRAPSVKGFQTGRVQGEILLCLCPRVEVSPHPPALWEEQEDMALPTQVGQEEGHAALEAARTLKALPLCLLTFYSFYLCFYLAHFTWYILYFYIFLCFYL